ncbi:b84dabff-39cf-4ab2-ae4d-813e940b0d7f [Thermothielavioides terrestris]|uniref:B84dabff-39cf-4ab2-ae4d-813e940b0d7f n=1 Tax=Thermothielavioides terrestris TaxID=2587410 RepID=A0A446BMP9_9PEZI|nr:b84dabff-39cf-4ab2-ae4d-813e940b0d7f [Thermothielavioides terrestris]
MHREHRRQRRTLQESGDFLGVTGANPQTGELDVITPPTGSEDAVATTTTTTTTTATAATTNAATAIATTARVSNSNKNRAAYVGAAGGAAPGVGVGAGVGMGTATDRLTTAGGSRDAVAKAQRKQQREEERLSRAAQRKDAVREAVRQQRVRWRREEGGWWSSAAEPALSPIPGSRSQSQSQSASRSSSAAPAPAVALNAAEQSQFQGAGFGHSSGGDGGVGHLRGGQQLHVVIPERRDSFLGMAAVARAVQASRRRLTGENVKLALVQRRQPEQVRLGEGDGQGNMPGRGWGPWRKTAAGFHVPPAIPPREGSLHPEGSRLEEYHQPEWDLGELVAIPVDIRRVSGDCKLDPRDGQSGPQEPAQPDRHGVAGESASKERGRPGQRVPICLHTHHHHYWLRTQSGSLPPRRAPLRRNARRVIRCSSDTATLDGDIAAVLDPKAQQRLLGLGLRMLMSPTPAQEKGETARPADEPIPLSPPVPGATAAERASDTTSSSISQAQTGVHTEAEVVNPPVSQGPVPAKHRAQQPDWAMRKTMRRQSDPDSSRSPNQRDSEAGTPRSSPTCTRTSTYRMNQSAAEAEAEEAAMAAECIARGAARTAFAQNRAHHQEIPWVKAITITGVMAGPVSTRNPGRQHMDRHPHHGPRAPGAAAQKGRGQGAEEAKQQEEGQEENGKRKGQKRKGKGGAGSGGELEVDVQRWTRMAVVMLERIVASYWQLVSPVFDGRSELRKRVDRAQATQGDVVVCVLAALFLFLVVSAVAWAVRGVVWMVKLWGELWDVLRAVAGL